MNDVRAKETNPVWWLVLTLLLVVGLMALFAALASPSGVGYGMMGWGWGWGMLMIVPVVVLVLILLVIVGANAARSAPPMYIPPVGPASSPIEILNARHVRGEISRDEYVRTRADLEGGSP